MTNTAMSTPNEDAARREWLESGRALLLPDITCEAFDDYLNTLPWMASALDWSKMPPSVAFNVVKGTRDELFAWATSTRIGRHTHLAVFYSRKNGGLVIPLALALNNLDELYQGWPGTRYCFSLDLVDGQLLPAYSDLLEWGKGDVWIAVA